MLEGGDRWGMLVAVRCLGGSWPSKAKWEMRCDCGSLCVRQANNLRRGRAHNCGCQRPKPGLTHGARHTREYRQWQGAKARCHSPGNKDYARYGARGIVVCERWRNDFSAFRADMGACPAGMSLDRIDTNGFYEPENCRWATASQQQRNKTNGARITIDGHRFDSITAAARHFGVSLTTINRWCNGFYDARRGSHTPPRTGAVKERAYQC